MAYKDLPTTKGLSCLSEMHGHTCAIAPSFQSPKQKLSVSPQSTSHLWDAYSPSWSQMQILICNSYKNSQT